MVHYFWGCHGHFYKMQDNAIFIVVVKIHDNVIVIVADVLLVICSIVNQGTNLLQLSSCSCGLFSQS
jgi:hypothetical protein